MSLSRVFNNLLTYDYELMLNSGLLATSNQQPATFNPVPVLVESFALITPRKILETFESQL